MRHIKDIKIKRIKRKLERRESIPDSKAGGKA